MNARQRVQTILDHREPDRIALNDAFWIDTLARWEREGLPPGTSPAELFDFDFDTLYLDASLRLPEQLLEDAPEYTVRQDKHGFVAKQWKGKAGALGYERHSVNTRADWERLQTRLNVDFGGTARIGPVSYFEPFVTYPTWEEMAAAFQAMRRREKYILLHVYGPFEATWRKHGFEQSLMDMALDPGLMGAMFEAHTDLVIATLERARAFGIVPDGVFWVEDRGVNTGPMFSLRQYRELLKPCDARLADYLHGHDMDFFMHSDGDIRAMIPDLIDSGLDVLQPLQARAGLDVRRLKGEYGDALCFMGNIDASLMDGDEALLGEEIETKIRCAMQGGGYIYHSDHSVPPTVSWERYRWIVACVLACGTYR